MNDEIISISKENCIEELKCKICYNIFQDPIMELPNQHIMCKICFFNYNNILHKYEDDNLGNLRLICPFCKEQITDLIKPRFIINMLNYLEMKCTSEFQNEKCNWKGNGNDYYKHIKICKFASEERKEKVKENCDKMREILNREITPHLKKEHLKIFNEHVKEWDWLENDERDWKWWWWSSMPWWENKSCEECNNLWHKYDDEIIIYENKRVMLLKSLN